MAQQFSNAARSELATGISAGDTTITLVDGSRFPEADAGISAVSDANLWFKAVLQDETGFEIVYVRTHAVATTPDTLSNVLRGQEGTTARAFAAGSVVGLRPLAADMDAAVNGRQPLLVSGTNIKTVGGQSLLGGGDVPLGGFLYGGPDPDNGSGSDGDVYIQTNGKLWKKAAGAWTYTGIQFAAKAAVTPTAGPSAVTFTRNAGVITQVSFTQDGKPGTTTFTRSGGLLTQVVTTYDGKTRTEVFQRNANGVLTGITATET